jgi:hypothetical protein
MKRTLISTGLVAAFGLIGNVHAQAISAADALAAPTQLFMSGATANAATIIAAVKSAMCASGSNEFTSPNALYTGKFFAVACNSPATGGNAVFYYTALGSNFGVNPVLYAGTGVATPKLDLNTCSGGVTACTGITGAASSTIPDVGYSDISPTAFTGPNTPKDTALRREFDTTFGGAGQFEAKYPDLFAAMQSDSAADETTTITGVNGMQFGIAISNILATSLNGVTSNYPVGLSNSQSVSKAAVAALMAGGLNGPQALAALGIADPSPSNTTKVVVCTRPATSGTKAWANLFFLGAGATPRAENATVPATAGGNWSGQAVAYVENLGSGDIRTCMTRASDSNIPAIGIISLEAGNLPSAARKYSFARLDGVAPDSAANFDRINTRNGLYTYVGEATMQNRGSLSEDQQTVVDAVVNSLKSSAVCGASGPTTKPDGASGNLSGCETRWSRGGDPFAVPKMVRGE